MDKQQPKFNAVATLAAIKEDRAVRRHRTTWGKSRLAKHRAELVKLRQAGGSFGDLVHWLKKEKRVTVDRTTVMRYLEKLPEMAERSEICVTADEASNG